MCQLSEWSLSGRAASSCDDMSATARAPPTRGRRRAQRSRTAVSAGMLRANEHMLQPPNALPGSSTGAGVQDPDISTSIDPKTGQPFYYNKKTEMDIVIKMKL